MTPTQKAAMEMALAALCRTDTQDTNPQWDLEVKAIEALRAALAEQPREPLFKPLIDQHPGLAEELAEQADDKADAERYRWIRENSWSSHIQQGTSSGIHYPTAWHVITGGSDTDIDAAIDAARSKT
jgi:hypothetical protein